MDTIAAIATAPGQGGIGVVRLSGPMAAVIATSLTGKPLPPAGNFRHRAFHAENGVAIDHGLVLRFVAPQSYTGEDVIELQGHGGPVVMDLLLARVTELGARLARPGEFSERAFLNNKLDLAQAEAVADLIAADSAAAARAAVQALQGEFSARVQALAQEMLALRIWVEAAIDFSDEEIDWIGDHDIAQRIHACADNLEALRASTKQGALLRDGMRIVLTGAPNVGKSSLLNRLAGWEAAIVTELPGTTRDVLRERILINGMPVHIVDTAGLREAADVVEAEGQRRAQLEQQQADHLLYVHDASQPWSKDDDARIAALPADVPLTCLLNKADLPMAGSEKGLPQPALKLSAHSGLGIDELRDHLAASVGYQPAASANFTARRRHLLALQKAAQQLQAAKDLLAHSAPPAELLAEELRLAHVALGEITGEVRSDELLGHIFSSFCIGK